MVTIYARLIEIKSPYMGKDMGIRFIAGTTKDVTLTTCMCWQGDYTNPGGKEAGEFERILKGFPYHADRIKWIL